MHFSSGVDPNRISWKWLDFLLLNTLRVTIFCHGSLEKIVSFIPFVNRLINRKSLCLSSVGVPSHVVQR